MQPAGTKPVFSRFDDAAPDSIYDALAGPTRLIAT
jgi:hypothetical protein